MLPYVERLRGEAFGLDFSRIRLLRDDLTIWLVYSGRRRRHFQDFRENGAIFLDLPGFQPSEAVFASEDSIRRHVAMADAVLKWARGGARVPPTRIADRYPTHPYASGTSEAKSMSADVGNVVRMFVDAKEGDIVISPSVGHFEPYLIGEIASAWQPQDELALPYFQNESVPYRRVRWLNTALARRDFSPKVSRRLQNQHAITAFDSELYQEILNTIYPAYAWGEYSKLDIFGYSYKGTDPLQPYPAARLVKYIAASAIAFERGRMDEFQALQPSAAIEAFYDESLIAEFGQNFNSPGKFTLAMLMAAMVTMVPAGIYVATADRAQPIAQTQKEAVNAVSGQVSGPGSAAHRRQVQAYVESMRPVNWETVQRELGEPAQREMPITLSDDAEVANHRIELEGR